LQAIVLNVQVGSGSLHFGDPLFPLRFPLLLSMLTRQNQGRLVAYLDEHRMLRQGLLHSLRIRERALDHGESRALHFLDGY
jgi:hypothetical protein